MKRWSASLASPRRVAGRRAILPRGAREDTAMASAIERGVALPVGQVSGEVVPFLVLQFEIGRHIRAETFIEELRGPQRPERVKQVERQAFDLAGQMRLGIHVDVEALARVAFGGDAI